MRKNPRSKKPSFKLKPMCAAVLLAFSVNAMANPNGGAVVNGSASFNTNGNTFTVTNTPGTIINWQGFSINSNEITHFAQQSASSAVLNRVITNNPSLILGTLSSNGRVFLVNPGGIVFGAGSTVNVAGMVATSLNLSDADFLAGRGSFTNVPGAQAVSNSGNITAQSGGEIYLIAPDVENTGIITAPNGEILLAAGSEVQLVNTLDPNLRVNITAPAGDATNVGQLVASAGRLGLFGTIVKNTGSVSADSATMQGGKIVFKASQRVELSGTVSANGTSGGSVNVAAAHSADVNTPGVVVQTGTIDALGTSGAGGSVQVSADNVLSTAAINVNGATTGGQIGVVAAGDIVTTSSAVYSANGGTASGGDILVAAGANSYSSGSYLAQGTTGGNIAMTASNLTLSAAKLDASGTNSGGVIHVGGVLHGAAGFAAQGLALNNAGNLTVTGTTKLIADAFQNGNGGEIVLWSDGTTLSGGAISAHGGALSGNGGFVEVSGKQTLGYAGALDVSAPVGAAGTLLLDPANIVIDSATPQGGVFTGVVSATLVDPHPVAGNKFGSYTYVLTNGNVVVAVPSDSLMASAAGAVYLFDGATGALISTLTGSYLSDQVGVGGVTALSNGNFVVNSYLWDFNDLGAVTWGSGTSGVNGVVSASNSLLGTFVNDNLGAPSVVSGWDARLNMSTTIGHGGVIALSNGNYVVSSPWAYSNRGVVTWGNGLGGTVGSANSSNSLVGTSIGDFIGTNVVALNNGNYVVGSSNWKNGAGLYRGAVTWVNGLSGLVGSVSAANSLIGSTNYDTVGASITALSNGNYVVNSYGWSSNSGAVTWGNGLGGTTGAVSISNSLVGTLSQNIGWGSGTSSTDGVVALVGNGNYVVNSSSAGFVTWGSGAGGTVGNLSSANSLQGTGGSYATKITALTNGHYVAANAFWSGAFSGMGAVTWGDGTVGTVGVVSAANSLVGSILNDNVGSGGVTALTTGNYVVTSHNWDNLGIVNVGAVTWGNGAVGTVGAVSSANSLVGATASDQIGWNGSKSMVVALSNGHYVVGSRYWDNGVADVGAATWGNGAGGTVGAVSSANSLVGSTASDQVGATIYALKSNGNYVVGSFNWSNAGAANAGAATWGNGLGGTVGAVSVANSIVGSTLDDFVSASGVVALTSGNYVIVSPNWDNVGAANAGAVTWGSGAGGTVGAVSALNSLVGDTAGDSMGSGGYITVLTNGDYVVNTPWWHSNTGHVAMGSGTTGLNGVASSANGTVGAVAGDYLGWDYAGAGSAGGTGNGIRVLPNGGYVISSMAYNGGPSSGFGRVTLEGVPRSSIPFALDQGLTTSINPLDIAAKLDAGTNVVLQANNDITQNVGAAITATGTGSLTMQAGRSILLNSSISIVGNLIVTANDPNAIGADRALGVAVLDASSATLSGGAMTFSNSGGSILLNNVSATGATNIDASGGTTLSGTNSFTSLTVPSALNAITIGGGTTTLSGALDNADISNVIGNLNVNAGATLNLNGVPTTTYINSLTLSGGTIGSTSGLYVNNLIWHGGTLTGAGLLTTDTTAMIDGAAVLLNKSWANSSGVVDFNGAGSLQLGGSGVTPVVFSNYGLVNFNGSSAAPITWATSATNKSFINYGSLLKNIGSAATQDITLNVVSNTASGFVNVKDGTLSINGGTVNSLVQQGAIIVDAGTTLRAGSFTNVVTTGELMGKGTFDMNGGILTNDGAILPAAWESGTLTITGDLVMGATGTLILNLNGTSAGQYDVLNVTGTANVAAGTLELSGVGAAASTYNVLNATGVLTGPFGVINSSTFTQGPHAYGANALTLNLTANAVASYITWDGGAGTANWNDAANWSGDLVPTATDSLYISITGFNLPTNINVVNYYQTGEGAAFQVAGDLTIHATNDITLAGGKFHSLNSNTFTLLADNNIIMGTGAQITADLFATSNVILNTDADGSGFGSINLMGSSISTSGGNITLGGGIAGNGTGWARGSSTSDVMGINLDGSTLDAWGNYGSGSIALNGRGYDSAVTNFADGVRITNASSVTTSDIGSITVNGVGGASASDNNGVRIDGVSTVSNMSGDIVIQGYGGLGTGTANMGVYLSGVGTLVDSYSGVINIAGTGGSAGTAGGSNRGVRIDLGAQVTTFNASSINISGVAAYGGDGLQIIGDGINPTGVFSSFSSEINLYGLSGDAVSGAHGVFISGAQTGLATDGNINISGTSIAAGTGGLNRGVRIEAGAKVDTSSLGGGNAGAINIVAQGGNRGDGFQLDTSSLLTDTGTINIVSQSGGNQAGSNALVGASILASTISSKGGNIFVSGTSNATFGSSNYGILVDTSNIETLNLMTGNITLIGQGGNGTDALTLSNNGVGVFGSTVSVFDGRLAIFGTAGTVTDGFNSGVELWGATTLVQATGAGSIFINGTLPSSLGAGTDSGVVVGAGADMLTVSGAIDVTGLGVNVGGFNYGVRVEGDGSTITSTSGNITITGSAETYGVGVTNTNAAALASMVSSGTGNLKIVSKAGDVFLSGTSTTVGVIAGASSLTSVAIISSSRHIILDSKLSFLSSQSLDLRVDNAGTGTGGISFTGTGAISAGMVNLYYNPTVFGTQNVFTNISADFTNHWMLVNNAANLQSINNNLAGSYALGKNLDMTGVVGYTPIGSNATPFAGQFDGLNREISNLTINSPAVSQVGLFGVIGVAGVVKNLGLTNVAINGDASVGALAGVNHGSIFNTYVSGGTVTGGNGATGGLVGVNQAGDGTAAVGVTLGTAGSNAIISNSYAEKVNVAVMAAINPAVGGLVGINRGGVGGAGGNGAISQAGAVGGAGGAVSITNSYVTGGMVSGMGTMAVQYVGGLVGQNIGGNGGNGGTGISSSAMGGGGGVGGVASISNSYSSSGVVSGTSGQRGGLIGRNLSGNPGALPVGTFDGAEGGLGVAGGNNLYWNKDSTGDISLTGVGANTGTLINVFGTVDAGMRSGSIGLDFVNTWWLSTPNDTLPMLRSEWSAEINNAHQLQLLDNNLLADYTLARDLDLASALTVSTGSVWTASGLIGVGTTYAGTFSGTFDGQGFTITNLKSDGLFGAIGASGVVSNVNLVSATGGGAVAATNQGLIINSSVANSLISKDNAAGALVGVNDGNIVNSQVTSTIVQMASAFSDTGVLMGGLVGQNNGIISNSFVSGGSVSGQLKIGGLVGANDGVIAFSHASNVSVSQELLGGTHGSFGGLVGSNIGGIVASYVSGGSVAGDGGNTTAGLVGGTGVAGTSWVVRSWLDNAVVLNISSTTGAAAFIGGCCSPNYLFDSHYDISQVNVNGAAQVQVGGLYTAQFNEWRASGRLDTATSAARSGITFTGGSGNISSGLNTQGMQDLLGFAHDPRYSFLLSGAVDISSLPNYSVPVLAGAFDGGGIGSAISGFNNSSDQVMFDVGLFAWLESQAVLANVRLTAPNVSGYGWVGALVGNNTGVIRDSSVVDANVSGVIVAGGLVGVNDGTILNSYVQGGSVSVSVSPTQTAMSVAVGGLVGGNFGTISNSYVTSGTLKVADFFYNVGGLVGDNAGSILTSHVIDIAMQDLQLTPTLLTLADNVGGLVGTNEAGASITNSYVDGAANVSGQNNVGGLVGNNIRGFSRGTTRIGIVDNSYFSGTSVTGQSYVGGLVGRDGYMTGDGSYIGVTNNYVSSGAVTGATFHGPLVGNGLPNTFTNNRYDVDAVTVNGNKVVLTGGLYTTQFIDWSTNGKSLNIADYSTALGSSLELINGKYTITNEQGMKDLLGFADNAANLLNADYSFALGNDITLSAGVNNYSIPVFTGSLDGQGNTISGVNIDMSTYDDVGFIQKLVSGASISNLGLIAPVVVGRTNVGGLVGINGWSIQTGLCSGTCALPPSTIFNSYVSGGSLTASLTDGSGGVGGLVGVNYGFISAAYVSGGTVDGAGVWDIGGFVGTNFGDISNSYASNNPTGGWSQAGGFAGTNDVSGLITQSMWDSTTFTGSGINVDNGNLNTQLTAVVDITSFALVSSALSGVTDVGGTTGNTWRIYDGQSGPLLMSFLKPLVITADATSKVYDGATYNGGLVNPTYTDGINPVAPNLPDILGTANAYGLNAINAGTYAPALYSGQQGYDISYVGGMLTIGTASLSVISLDGTRVYDGTANVDWSIFTLAGLIGSQTLTISGVGTVADANVGISKPVTLGTLALGDGTNGGLASNYTFTGGTYTASITPATLTYTANAASRTYGANDPAFSGSVTGFMLGETLATATTGTASFNTAALNTSNVGGYAINGSGLTDITGNYVFAQAANNASALSITPATLTYTANTGSRMYGDPNPAFSGTVTGFVLTDDLASATTNPATLTFNTSAPLNSNVGSYAINGSGLTANNGNYTFVQAAGNASAFSITQRIISVIADLSSKVYGDADPNLFSVGGGLASWDTNATAFTGSLSHTGGENVGTYTITQGSLLANANYNLSGFTGNNLLITPATLTVVADSKNKVLGTPDPLLTYMTYGLKLNDTAATILSGQLDREVGDTIGSYSIKQGNLILLSSNYYPITYVAGTFRILAPTVVQEITQTSLQSAPAEDTATTSEEEEKKESAELLAEAAIVDDSGQPLAEPLPVCR
jgi:filamentous hemagglutinin family protein